MAAMALDIDKNNEYVDISRKFCELYYLKYDSDFNGLAQLFRDDVKISFIDNEFIGFNRLYQCFVSDNIHKIIHSNIKWNCQPIANNAILINITGDIQINMNIVRKKFNETIVLRKFGYSYFITNCIFKII